MLRGEQVQKTILEPEKPDEPYNPFPIPWIPDINYEHN